MFRAPQPSEPLETKKYLTGYGWRRTTPQYVNSDGLLTSYSGEELDEAIKNHLVMTGSEWRQLNKNKKVTYIGGEKSRDFYVDCFTGLPAVDPETGYLLVVIEPVGRQKIISGEWITIKEFLSRYGEIEFINKQTQTPVNLSGAALFSAINKGVVIGRLISTHNKLKASVDSEPEERKRIKRQCTPTPPPLPQPEPSPSDNYNRRNANLLFSLSSASDSSSTIDWDWDALNRDNMDKAPNPGSP